MRDPHLADVANEARPFENLLLQVRQQRPPQVQHVVGRRIIRVVVPVHAMQGHHIPFTGRRGGKLGRRHVLLRNFRQRPGGRDFREPGRVDVRFLLGRDMRE